MMAESAEFSDIFQVFFLTISNSHCISIGSFFIFKESNFLPFGLMGC